MKKCKFSTVFASIVRCPTSEERNKGIVLASLDELAPFLPKEVDLKANYDLLPFSTASFVGNMANGNGDIVATKEITQFYKNFAYKRLDLEHSFAHSCGVIANAGFSKFNSNYIVGGTSSPLTIEEVNKLSTPFNVVIGGYIWKVGNDKLVELLEESNDPESPNYLSVSASFELGFDEYIIALGTSNLLSECELITDDTKVKELSQYLKAYKGNGKYDSKNIYRLIKGEIVPLGTAITMRPAADVKGILVGDSRNVKVNPPAAASKDEVNKAKTEDVNENTDNNKTLENSSDLQKHCVKGNSNMKIKSVEELKGLKDEQFKELTVANVTEILEDAIKAGNEQYKAKLDESKNALKTAEEAKASVEKQTKEIKENLEKVSKELDAMKQTKASEELEKKFNGRMEHLDKEYNLDDNDRKVIAKQIQPLTDETFKTWLDDFVVLAAAKKKVAKKADEEMMDEEMKKKMAKEKMAKASEDTEEGKKAAQELLDKAKTDKKGAPANVTTGAETFETKYANAFSLENISIK